MTIAIHQPNYLPYPGYFDKWDRADLFVFLDHVPYSRSGWQNRNFIRTGQGAVRLSVPVRHQGRSRAIRDAALADRSPWRRKHRTAIELAYARAGYLDSCRTVLDEMYDPALGTLGAVNIACCLGLGELLGITTPWVVSSALGPFTASKTALLIEICRRVGAEAYLCGDGAAVYLDTGAFDDGGIELLWQHYVPPVYPQRHPATGPGPSVSVLDLIANTGPEALPTLRSARTGAVSVSR